MKRTVILTFMLVLSAFFAERASAQTASAHGSGTVSGLSGCTSPICVPLLFSEGGKGVSFSFSFSGTGTGVVGSIGTFTAVDKETNISLKYLGVATIDTNLHNLTGSGPCMLTAPDGTSQTGTCNFQTHDGTSGGGADGVTFFGLTGAIVIAGCGGGALNSFLATCPPMASGNINID